MAESDITELACGTTTGSKGAWYLFSSQNKSIVRLEYELKVEEQGNSVLSVFNGSCGAGLLICEDYVVGYVGYNSWYDYNDVAVYEFQPEIGQEYFFLLSGESSDTAGEYKFIRVLRGLLFLRELPERQIPLTPQFSFI